MINDLATDRRVQKTCAVLMEKGYEVILIGRKLPGSLRISHLPYSCKRMKLLFKKGPAFYFFFNLRLFFFLLFSKADLFVANDLDTLYPNFNISRWKKIKLVYDSHEIFTEVPELQHTPLKKKIWENLEKRIVPKLQYCITVNESIAKWFHEKYNVNFHVIRNIPPPAPAVKLKSKTELGLPADKKIVLLQGAGINIQRGAEEAVEAMRFVENAVLLIIGSGDVFPELKRITSANNIESKVIFKNKMTPLELFQYTGSSDLGLTLDKDTNLNYRYSLPNKIFDYINAGIPVLASHLPEIESFINRNNVGTFIETHDPLHIASKIQEALTSPEYSVWKENTKKASAENSWEKEKQVWDKILSQFNL